MENRSVPYFSIYRTSTYELAKLKSVSCNDSNQDFLCGSMGKVWQIDGQSKRGVKVLSRHRNKVPRTFRGKSLHFHA